MKYGKVIPITILVLTIAGIAHAAPFSQAFRNDYQTDSIYLFITEGDVEFIRLQRAPRNWEIGIDQPDVLSIFGPVIDPGNRFRVRFSDRGDFNLEWAELLNGTIMGTGSLVARNGRFVGANDIFTSQSQLPTPTTGTLWLLGSGLVCLFCVRRKLTGPNGSEQDLT